MYNTEMPKSIRQLAADKYAGIAVNEAENANNDGTFGVGGLLIDDRGTIRKVVRNRVIQNSSVHDPTAHVERQLVDWYFSEKARKDDSLPPASKMTIISSLDPCVMCSGAILAGGLDVIRISQDNESGVSCKGPGNFSTLPEGLEQRAKETFSAFGVLGKRPFSGPPSSILYGHEIDGRLDQRSLCAFSSSLKKIRGIINDHEGLPPDRLSNPRTLAKTRPQILKLLRKYNPEVFSKEHVIDFDKPGINLGRVLVQKARESYERRGVFSNSACLVDPFGNMLISEGGAEEASPIRTAFLEMVRKYHKLQLEAEPEGKKYLAHIKYCKTVLLLGPGRDAKSLMEVGSLGSSVEGELPKACGEYCPLQYVIPLQERDDLERMLDSLPPFYSDTVRIKDTIQEVKDAKLQTFCKSKMSE